MWGDESDNEDEEKKEEKDDDETTGQNGDSQSELVAKDDNKGSFLSLTSGQNRQKTV